MKELLEAGVHFGHQVRRWNPKMKEYIFGERNGIYILDLNKTVKKFRDAEEFVTNLAADGKTMLFVGTKRQAQDVIAEEAQPILLILEWGVAAERWTEVKRLGHAVEEALALSGKWDMWNAVLQVIQKAAQAKKAKKSTSWGW